MSGPSNYKLRVWMTHDGWWWAIANVVGRDIITAPHPFKSNTNAASAARRAVNTIRGAKIEDITTNGAGKYARGKYI